MAGLIDEVFAQTVKEEKQSPFKKSAAQVAKTVQDTAAKKTKSAEPEKDNKPKESSKSKEAEKEKKAQDIEKAKKAFRDHAPAKIKSLKNDVVNFKQEVANLNNHILAIKENTKRHLEHLKTLNIPLDMPISDLPDLSIAEKYSFSNFPNSEPIKTALNWALLKYSKQALVDAFESLIEELEVADPEKTPNLDKLLLKQPKPIDVGVEFAKSRLIKEMPELFKMVLELSEKSNLLLSRANYVKSGVPISTHLAIIENEKLDEKVREEATEKIWDFVANLQEYDNQEVKNFLITFLTNNPQSPLSANCAYTLGEMWAKVEGSFNKEAYESFSEKVKHLIDIRPKLV